MHPVLAHLLRGGHVGTHTYQGLLIQMLTTISHVGCLKFLIGGIRFITNERCTPSQAQKIKKLKVEH